MEVVEVVGVQEVRQVHPVRRRVYLAHRVRRVYLVRQAHPVQAVRFLVFFEPFIISSL